MILERIFDRTATEQRGSWEVVLEAFNQNRENAGGDPASPSAALKFGAVFACVRILAESVASLPLILYERQERGKRRATEFYLYNLLHDRPNEMMTAFEFRETVQGHLALWGNAYSQIEYDDAGRIIELWPLNPGMMLETKVENGQRLYHYQLPNGNLQWISGYIIWHLRGLGNDGLNGYSPIGLMRKAVGLGMAAEEFGSRFFKNDARPGIVLEHPGKLSDTAHKNLKESWGEEHKGVSKSHRVAILEEGIKLHEIGIPPEDAQFLETRKFQVQEIARIFRIPPHMLADLERATFSNIEHQGIDFVVHTLRPWLVRWEQSILQNLMLSKERERYFAEFLVDGLLRGDTKSRYDAYAVGRNGGWLSANDIRELENMNPIEGGDAYLVPLNMVPADSVADGSLDQQSPDEDNQNRGNQAPIIETRAVPKTAQSRHRLQRSWRKVYRETAARVLRRESNDIRAAARKYLANGDTARFSVWLADFYRQHVEFVMRQFRPVGSAYSELVADEAADEVAATDYEERVERFVESYTGGFSVRHTESSKFLLQKRLQEAQAAGKDLEEALTAELDHWLEIRPDVISGEESVRLNNAVARLVYIIGGRQYIKWVTFGENCPYCNDLDGATVGVESNFLNAGQDYQPEGAERPLTSSSDVGHPPAHDGCDCMAVAG